MKQFVLGVLSLALIYLAYDAYGYRYYLKKIHLQMDQESVLGDPNSDIKILAYVDYNSAASRRLYGVLLNLVSLKGDVAVILRPVETNEGMSKLATRMAIAAQDQGKFIEVSNFFLTNTAELSEPYIRGVMRTLNLQYSRLERAINTNHVVEQATQYQAETKLLGVNGLPYVFVNHVRMSNNAYSLKAFTNVIDDLRSGRR